MWFSVQASAVLRNSEKGLKTLVMSDEFLQQAEAGQCEDVVTDVHGAGGAPRQAQVFGV